MIINEQTFYERMFTNVLEQTFVYGEIYETKQFRTNVLALKRTNVQKSRRCELICWP